ncbi:MULTISPECIES: S41 family peptidase [unclassified Pedobacter]|uniref:S41 family peptidase n=1 Tax=unclassified Pedobacter TaxID=2628915 RepID=UPI001E4A865B|nr:MULTISPECIES: S41 family peptidase [unclassified Pedobacter]
MTFYLNDNRLAHVARRGMLYMLVLALFTTSKLLGQESKNIADLDFLYRQIQHLPSYKAQLKGKKSYQSLYQEIRKDLSSSDEFEVYQKLLLLIHPINDNHLGFWRKPDPTTEFKPRVIALDTTETTAKFSLISDNSIEGIYLRIDGSKHALLQFKTNFYYLQNFKTGIIEAIINRTAFGSYDAILFIGLPVPYVLNRNFRIKNGKLGNLNFYKVNHKLTNPLLLGQRKFEYRKIKPEISYLRLSSFSASNDNFRIAKAFYDSIRTEITTPYLVVDLRNNLGGGYRTSKQFLTLLKKYRGTIFLLQNSNTVSNAEQFLIDLRSKKKLMTLGETTRGTITYGSNYGNTVTLPSGRFIFYPTDMRGRAKDLVFESIGIEPDVFLGNVSDDWIEQTLKYVNNRNMNY